MIQGIVQKEDQLNQMIAELNSLDRGHVRLGIFNSMCKYLPELIRSFNQKYPHITFEIFQGSYEDIMEWLKNGTVDIGFLSKTVNPGFPFYEIFSDPLMCILQKGTASLSETEIPLGSLENSPFVMQRESCDADARRIMEHLHLDVRTVCHVVDDKTTVEMVKAGFGFAIMPLLTMDGFEQEVKMLRIAPPAKRIIGVAVRNEQDLSPAVRKVFDHIKRYDFSA